MANMHKAKKRISFLFSFFFFLSFLLSVVVGAIVVFVLLFLSLLNKIMKNARLASEQIYFPHILPIPVATFQWRHCSNEVSNQRNG